MIVLALWVLYGLGYLVAWRRIAWVLAHEFDDRIDAGDVLWGVGFGAVVSLFWPLVVPGYYLSSHPTILTNGAHALLKAPKHVADKERIASQEVRIRELERELGIGSSTSRAA